MTYSLAIKTKARYNMSVGGSYHNIVMEVHDV